MPPRARFIAAELLVLAATVLLGGPPWTFLATIAVALVALGDLRVGAILRLLPALLWLGLSRATGNRELFFPYAMFLASHAGLVLATAFTRGFGALGAAAIVAAFLAIRTVQSASMSVLAVETAVAIAILVVVFMARGLTRRSPTTDTVIAVSASLLAYAGLAL